MTVKHEIKSQLAKLLATEDLIVEHRKVATAQFDVHSRVLTLPMWEKASNTVYDLLVGHEVGHALFTPDENWLEKKRIPPQFVNVVEDARIEKMMKRKYAGLSKTFYNGYKELNEEDFFALSDSDISDFNLADRANLYFKVGNFLDFSFTKEEKDIIVMIGDCETFDDVLEAADVLYQYCKKNLKEPENKTNDVSQSEQQSEDENVDKSEESKPEGQIEESSEEGGETNSDLDVQTADALSENIENLVSHHGSENIYLELPEVNLDTVIVSNKDVHEYIDCKFNMQDKLGIEAGMKIFENVDSEYVQFKRSAQKEVNYLVKEFECKKAADSYARATTARTGVLDCTKLHTYKYNEDLFKKVTTLADGKNHGLIFMLDWSGSMQYTLLDTCKQMFNLLWFCKKVGIPFDVYTFTNEWCSTNDDGFPANVVPHYTKKENLLAIDDDFNLLNILSSKTSSKELERQMINIWRHAYAFARIYRMEYQWGRKMTLSGTPLNESLVCLHQILPKFQSENRLQKVQCIVLTDGEACGLNYHRKIKRYWENDSEYIGTGRFDAYRSILRDRKTGNTYNFKEGYVGFIDVILTNLKDNFPNVNFIGIRLLGSRDATPFMKLYYEYGDEFLKLQSQWKKEKSFVIRRSGYDAYFGLSCAALSQDVEFDVDEGATKAKIKSAFAKSLKTKKLNKKVLGEFVSLVA